MSSSELRELEARARAYEQLAEAQWANVVEADAAAKSAATQLNNANEKYERLIETCRTVNTQIQELRHAYAQTNDIVGQEAVIVDGSLVMATVKVGPDTTSVTLNDGDRE